MPGSKEPQSLIGSDGRRPDGATLVPWAKGKYIAWDATSIHTCFVIYIRLTLAASGQPNTPRTHGIVLLIAPRDCVLRICVDPPLAIPSAHFALFCQLM